MVHTISHSLSQTLCFLLHSEHFDLVGAEIRVPFRVSRLWLAQHQAIVAASVVTFKFVRRGVVVDFEPPAQDDGRTKPLVQRQDAEIVALRTQFFGIRRGPPQWRIDLRQRQSHRVPCSRARRRISRNLLESGASRSFLRRRT